MHGHKVARLAFLGAQGPALDVASVFQPLHLPAPIMGVMSAHPSLSQGTPRAGCLSVMKVLMFPKDMPARPSCSQKVSFSTESGIPPVLSEGEALILSICLDCWSKEQHPHQHLSLGLTEHTFQGSGRPKDIP